MARFTLRVALVILLMAVPGINACAQETKEMTPADLTAFATDYTAAWGSQDPASVAAFFAEDGSLRINDGEPSIGRAEIRATARSFMTALPDMVLVMDSLGRAGDRVTYDKAGEHNQVLWRNYSREGSHTGGKRGGICRPPWPLRMWQDNHSEDDQLADSPY